MWTLPLDEQRKLNPSLELPLLPLKSPVQTTHPNFPEEVPHYVQGGYPCRWRKWGCTAAILKTFFKKIGFIYKANTVCIE